MKKINLIFVFIASIFIVVLLFISGCAKQQPNQNLEFKQMCQQAGYEWMYMKPSMDGKIMKDAQECWGCMVEHIEHVCDMEKFNELINPDKETDERSMQHTMQHNSITAHAGSKNSVDVHMYKVGFVRPDAKAGKEVMIKFTINEMDSCKPISNLQIAHDKIMHVALVRNDLRHFDHIHPEISEPGIFAVPYNLSSAGIYRVWVDFTIDGMQHIVDFDMNVAGNTEAEEKNTLDGLKINFNKPKEVAAGRQVELKFEISDDNNKPLPITKKFLGAAAHLIEIDQTLEEFGHNHDESFDKDNIISFKHTFSKVGRHKLWVQFLADNKLRTASFEVMVN